jgi:hypothetical protein
VEHALLVELLESVDCRVLARRLTEHQNKQGDVRANKSAKIAVNSIHDLGNLSESLIKELCGGDAAVIEQTLAAVARLQKLSVPECMALVCEDHFAVKEQVWLVSPTFALRCYGLLQKPWSEHGNAASFSCQFCDFCGTVFDHTQQRHDAAGREGMFM